MLRPYCARLNAFTVREQQVIDGLLAGKRIKEVAADLNLSINTVKEYAKAIYQKAAVQSARELVARFLQNPQQHDQPREVAALIALTESRSPQQLLDAAVEALKAWTGAQEAIVIAPVEGDPEYPSIARGALSRGSVISISRALARADVMLRDYVADRPMNGEPILVGLRIPGKDSLVLLLDPRYEDWKPLDAALMVVEMAAQQRSALGPVIVRMAARRAAG